MQTIDDVPERDVPATPATWTLPDGGRLVHIGPPKTGTTALQAAFFAVRESLIEQGVRYVGKTRHSADAIRAVMGRPSYRHRGRVPPIRPWLDLVQEITEASGLRTVLSSEFLAGAEPDTVARIVADLDPARTYAIAVLRPLTALLPSQWQQDVRRGSRDAFEPWLRNVLATDSRSPAQFWRGHRYDRILAQWTAALGTDHVVGVVLDDRDRTGLYRAFEDVLRLREGSLQPQLDVPNRSLTLGEAEAVRALNAAFAQSGLDWTDHARMVHLGAARQLWRRPPDPADPRIELPAWAVDRALELDEEMVGKLADSGIRIIGDAQALLRQPERRPGPDPQPEVRITPDTAAAMAIGLLYGTGLARDPQAAGAGDRPATSPVLAHFTTRELASAVAHRSAGYVRRRGSGLAGRLRATRTRT